MHYRQDFNEIIFQTQLDEIKAIAVKEEASFVKEKQKQVLYLFDKQDRLHRLSTVETNPLKAAIEQRIEADGDIIWKKNPVFPEPEEDQIAGLLTGGRKGCSSGEKSVVFDAGRRHSAGDLEAGPSLSDG